MRLEALDMTEIKYVIKILCEHLNLLFALNLKPEQFRLAKFNKSDENARGIVTLISGKLENNPNT